VTAMMEERQRVGEGGTNGRGREETEERVAEKTPALREEERKRERELYSRGEPVFRISDDSSLATTQRQVHFLAWRIPT